MSEVDIPSNKVRKHLHGFSLGDKIEGFVDAFQKTKADLPGVGMYNLNGSMLSSKRKQNLTTFGSQERFKFGISQAEKTDFIYDVKSSWIKGKNKTIGKSKRISDSNLVNSVGSGLIGPGYYQYRLDTLNTAKKVNVLSTFGNETRLKANSQNEGSQSQVHSYFPQLLEKKSSIVIPKAEKLGFIVYDKQIPGVGRYDTNKSTLKLHSFRSRNSSMAQISYRRNETESQRDRGQRMRTEESQMALRSQSQFSIGKSSSSKGIAFPKYKRWHYKNIDYEPSPNDFVYDINNYRKGTKFTQSRRPQYEKQNPTPGVGYYEVETPNKSTIEMRVNKRTSQSNLSNSDAKYLNTEDSAQTKDLKTQRQINAKRKILQELKITDMEDDLETLIKNNVPLQSIIQQQLPAPGQYNLSTQSSIANGATFQKTNRKHEYLDVYNKPPHYERSPGPAFYDKQDKLDRGIKVAQEQRPDNIFGISDAPSIGTYNVDRSSFEKAQVKKKITPKKYYY